MSALDRGTRPIERLRGVFALTVALLLLAVIVFRLSASVPAWDALVLQASAQRVDRLGGSLYETGADHKGPLWIGSYWVVTVLPDWTYWFGIASFAVLTAAATAWAIFKLVVSATSDSQVALYVAAVGGLALTLGPEEYSGVFYSRNITAALIACALSIVVKEVPDRSSRVRRLIGSGVLLGLAIQTMPTAILPATVVLLAGAWHARPSEGANLRGAGASFAWCGFALVLTAGIAPVYYWLRGGFHDFWLLFWEYNQVYNRAAGRDLRETAELGWTNFASYYGQHPVLAVACIAGILIAVRRCRQGSFIELFVVGWWITEIASVVAAQRFFPHYLVLPFVPTVVMAGYSISHLVAMRAAVVRGLPPVTIVAVAAMLIGGPRFFDGVRRLSEASSIGHVEQRLEGLPPQDHAVAAVSEAISTPDQFALYWLRAPFPYRAVNRTSASRYLESRWLTGEVYGGSTSPTNVLPGTWERWASDIQDSDPSIAVVYPDVPIPGQSPLDKLLSDEFDLIFNVDGRQVFARKSRARPSPCIRWEGLTGRVSISDATGDDVVFEITDAAVSTRKGDSIAYSIPVIDRGGPHTIEVHSRSVVVWNSGHVVGAAVVRSPQRIRFADVTREVRCHSGSD